MLDLARGYEVAHLRAVEIVAFDLERRDDLDLMSVLAQPVRAASASPPEGEVVADDPGPQLHHRREPVDELLWRERGQLTVEAQDDRMRDARRLDQRELFLERRDRLRAVGGVQDAPWMRLERDQRRLRID